MKTKQATKELLEEHYKDLVEKPFFPKLRDYMLSGPVVCMVWEVSIGYSEIWICPSLSRTLCPILIRNTANFDLYW